MRFGRGIKPDKLRIICNSFFFDAPGDSAPSTGHLPKTIPPDSRSKPCHAIPGHRMRPRPPGAGLARGGDHAFITFSSFNTSAKYPNFSKYTARPLHQIRLRFLSCADAKNAFFLTKCRAWMGGSGGVLWVFARACVTTFRISRDNLPPFPGFKKERYTVRPPQYPRSGFPAPEKNNYILRR